MMENILNIPEADPIPLPAPVPLLKFLLLLTFILHIIPMNLLLGGSIIALITELSGRNRDHGFSQDLVRDMSRFLPVVTTYAVTLGVAPLLFVQVLYGQFFYTSSVLMAWPWLLIVPLLILGYYGLYTCYLKGDTLGPKGTWIKIGSASIFVLIGFLYTNNLVLMLTPEKWTDIYAASARGIHLNLGDPTIFPRYLHFLLAALAITGLFLMVVGLWNYRKGATEYGHWLIIYGSRWFIFPTLLQIVVGSLFLFSLPAGIRDSFIWQNTLTMPLLGLGIIFALIGVGAIFLASLAEGSPGIKLYLGIGCIVLTLVFMSIVRHLLRETYISPHFQPEQLAVATPVSVLLLFIILLLLGLLIVGYMVWKVIQAGREVAS
jgi:hypothetical protein